jgi:hypothetical protein
MPVGLPDQGLAIANGTGSGSHYAETRRVGANRCSTREQEEGADLAFLWAWVRLTPMKLASGCCALPHQPSVPTDASLKVCPVNPRA